MEIKTSKNIGFKTQLSRDELSFRHHVRVRRRIGHHKRLFLKQTISAQIHAWGALLSFLCIVCAWCIVPSSEWRTALAITVFGVTAVMLFSASAIMHFLTDGFRISKRFELVLEKFDKVSVHLLIAGTYTAIAQISLKDPMYSRIMWSVWIFALLGIVYTLTFDLLPKRLRSRVLYTSQFLIMGWLIVFCVQEMLIAFTVTQAVLAFLGGILYSIGAVIYAFQYPNPTRYFGYHEIWHSLVLFGCACFFSVVFLGIL